MYQKKYCKYIVCGVKENRETVQPAEIKASGANGNVIPHPTGIKEKIMACISVQGTFHCVALKALLALLIPSASFFFLTAPDIKSGLFIQESLSREGRQLPFVSIKCFNEVEREADTEPEWLCPGSQTLVSQRQTTQRKKNILHLQHTFSGSSICKGWLKAALRVLCTGSGDMTAGAGEFKLSSSSK